jgi:hypothetical protein
MLAQVAQAVGADQLACRLRQQDLSAVTRGRDARGAVHVDSDVSLVRQQRLAGVHTHPHPDRPVERRLHLPRRCERIRRPPERDEKRIALRVHLDAAVTGERLT